MPSHWYAILTAVVCAGVQFVLFLRWLHRRMRDDEIVRTFVRDIAANHLPHIYTALREIAKRQGIEPAGNTHAALRGFERSPAPFVRIIRGSSFAASDACAPC